MLKCLKLLRSVHREYLCTPVSTTEPCYVACEDGPPTSAALVVSPSCIIQLLQSVKLHVWPSYMAPKKKKKKEKEKKINIRKTPMTLCNASQTPETPEFRSWKLLI